MIERPAAITLSLLALCGAPSSEAQTPAPKVDANTFRAGMRSVKFEVANFERAAAFYVALGMRVTARRDTTWDLAWPDPAQGSGIQMTTPEYAKRAEMVRGGAMMIFMTPDIVAAADRLHRAGFADVPAPRPMGTMASVLMVRDPDGNKIELIGPPLVPASR
jgi:catechol 2,3-dioxygenase-like lactoylglutathione lyase family enzyme